ncbi:hypothetical protein [Solwaraspora sp. WMMA2101]|uniref:hypothetical protein n=1 Tax=Solwaraspora sp. WMMA2101 TaxID=3404124 RepID=UPI003B94E129
MHPDDIERTPAYRLIEEALTQLAPKELPFLPAVWDAFLADPGPHRRGRSIGLVRFGEIVGDLGTWAPVVVSFLGGVLLNMMTDATAAGTTGLFRRIAARSRRRRAARQLQAGALPDRQLTAAERADLVEQARTYAQAVGRTPADADRLVRVTVIVIDRLSRDPH